MKMPPASVQAYFQSSGPSAGAKLAATEALLVAGPQVEGLCKAFADRSAELRILGPETDPRVGSSL